MKNYITIVICGLSLSALMAFTTINRTQITPIPLNINPTSVIESEIKFEEVKIEVKGHNQFLEAIGHRESSNNYLVVNEFGYMGRYQFGRATLKGLGINVTREEFINNPKLQERAMHMLLSHNQKKLKRYIKKYEGQVIHGVLITESGMLAAAHLAGQGNVRKFLKNGFVFEDGNGTKMTSYMVKFSHYQLEF